MPLFLVTIILGSLTPEGAVHQFWMNGHNEARRVKSKDGEVTIKFNANNEDEARCFVEERFRSWKELKVIENV